MNDQSKTDGTNLNIAIFGASGGIGSALLNALQHKSSASRIFAISSRQNHFDHGNITAIKCDITNEQSIENAARDIKQACGHLDIIIIATGMLHDHAGGIMPEKSLRDLNLDTLNKVFQINTFAPAIIAKHFVPLLPKNRRSIFAAISARVGSITDNRLGGWHAYRASKSALNMLIKNIAIETARRNKSAIITGLHPGSVDTELSEPFQNNIPKEQLFTPSHSAEKMLQVIETLTPEHSGKIFAWDGKEIPP